ncbi:MAG: hypothetical protein QW273_01030 [Candidatus Pacearchaeota archaeon]
MKDKILFFNVGSRDVKLDEKEIEKEKIREKGEEILKNFDLYRDRISIEIIRPYLEKFAEETKKIYLFVTNQNDEFFKKKDSLFFGKIIEKIIEEEYKIEVEVKEYQNDPTDYEKVYAFFINFFSNFKNSEEIKILSISGGVPAMNFVMQIVATTLLTKTEIYKVNESAKKIESVNYEKTIKKEFIKKACIELLERYEYTGIITLLEKNEIYNKDLIHLLKYCDYRLHFDFDSANKELEKLIEKKDSLTRKELKKFEIKIEKEEDLIGELYINMIIKWEKSEIVDFIARLQRFSEAYLQYIFSKAMNIKINWEDEKESNKKFKECITKETELFEQIKYYYEKKGKSIEDLKVNKMNLYLCLPYFQKKRLIEKEIDKSIDKINKIIDKYRHLSIIAHGFKGVSKEDILKEFGSEESLKELLGTLLEKMKIKKEDEFAEIKKRILEKIEKI